MPSSRLQPGHKLRSFAARPPTAGCRGRRPALTLPILHSFLNLSNSHSARRGRCPHRPMQTPSFPAVGAIIELSVNAPTSFCLYRFLLFPAKAAHIAGWSAFPSCDACFLFHIKCSCSVHAAQILWMSFLGNFLHPDLVLTRIKRIPLVSLPRSCPGHFEPVLR